jgi:hypothetical protein
MTNSSSYYGIPPEEPIEHSTQQAPSFGAPGPRHAAYMPPEQFTPSAPAGYASSRYRMSGRRVACGICWAIWTLAFIIGIFSAGSVGGSLLCLALAPLAGWYDYRIWSGKARRLTFFVVF